MIQKLYDQDEEVPFVRLSAECFSCGDSHGADVTADRWELYVGGSLVQDVWPHRSVETREIIIANRPGNAFGMLGYLCPTCVEIETLREDGLS